MFCSRTIGFMIGTGGFFFGYGYGTVRSAGCCPWLFSHMPCAASSNWMIAAVTVAPFAITLPDIGALSGAGAIGQYCRSMLPPDGSVTGARPMARARLAFAWLGTYSSKCADGCRMCLGTLPMIGCRMTYG